MECFPPDGDPALMFIYLEERLKPSFKNNRNPDKRDFFQYPLEGCK